MSYCSTGPNLVLGGYPVSPTTKSTNLPIGIGQVSTIVEPLDEDHEDEVAEDEDQEEDDAAVGGEPREMLTPLLREALTKQGYRLIGSHSGVKLCRWTKVHTIVSCYFTLFIFFPNLF